MSVQSILHTYKRLRTLQTDTIRALPVVILMPHSACNCRCVMCDIWKDNKNLKQLNEKDVSELLESFSRLGTQQVVLSGGEALLNPNLFRLCAILKKRNIKISLLSTGLTLKKNAAEIIRWIDDVIVSLDGDEVIHNQIRNIPDAYQKLREGVEHIKNSQPSFRITGRTVIHHLNFRKWPAIIESAREIGLDQISFLPADVSSHAFNREMPWGTERQQEILLAENEVAELKQILEGLIEKNVLNFNSRFIAESPEKLRKIHAYYAAFYGHNPFPFKKCNAPWVSAVIEADGTVRPCFFHPSLGNVREESLENILNSEQGIRFRKDLDIEKDPTCMKCVCYLHLAPGTKLS